jgi:hypothetical protein
LSGKIVTVESAGGRSPFPRSPTLPPSDFNLFTGHNGWIDLDVEDKQDWTEITALALESYRHFALKRMLQMLDVSRGPA